MGRLCSMEFHFPIALDSNYILIISSHILHWKQTFWGSFEASHWDASNGPTTYAFINIYYRDIVIWILRCQFIWSFVPLRINYWTITVIYCAVAFYDTWRRHFSYTTFYCRTPSCELVFVRICAWQTQIIYDETYKSNDYFSDTLRGTYCICSSESYHRQLTWKDLCWCPYLI